MCTCVYTGFMYSNVLHVLKCPFACVVKEGEEEEQSCVFLGSDPDVTSCWFIWKCLYLDRGRHFNCVLGNKSGKDGSPDVAYRS